MSAPAASGWEGRQGQRIFVEAPAIGISGCLQGRGDDIVKIEQRRARDPSAEFIGQGDRVDRFSPSISSEQFFESSVMWIAGDKKLKNVRKSLVSNAS